MSIIGSTMIKVDLLSRSKSLWELLQTM